MQIGSKGPVYTETEIMRDIREAVNATGKATLWRNSVGYDSTTRVKYGLGVGSADLVGFMHETGQMIAIEVKTPVGRLSKEQKLWLAFCAAKGARVGVARSVEEALAILDGTSTYISEPLNITRVKKKRKIDQTSKC